MNDLDQRIVNRIMSIPTRSIGIAINLVAIVLFALFPRMTDGAMIQVAARLELDNDTTRLIAIVVSMVSILILWRVRNVVGLVIGFLIPTVCLATVGIYYVLFIIPNPFIAFLAIIILALGTKLLVHTNGYHVT